MQVLLLLAVVAGGPAAAEAPGVDLIVSSGGTSALVARPGEALSFEVRAAVRGGLGLASFRLDLEVGGGALKRVELGPELGAFVPPAGLAERACTADGPTRIGAAQNPWVGGLEEGVGVGEPAVLARGVVAAPLAEGTYLLRVTRLCANVLVEDARGRRIVAARPGASSPLAVRVSAGAATPPVPPEALALPPGPDAAAWARQGRDAAGLQPRAGDPLPGLSPDELARFEAGRERFVQLLREDEGLGPAYNDAGCAVCHSDPVPGGAGTIAVVRFGRLGPPFEPLTAEGGSLLQVRGTHLDAPEYIPKAADHAIERITTPLFGAGLVERVPDADLLAGGGEPNRVVPFEAPGGGTRVGRFGWKAQHATLLSFTAEAARDELGLTSEWLPDETAPNGDLERLRRYDHVPDPEDAPDEGGRTRIERWLDFQRMLAPPPQTPLSGTSGETLFHDVGCAACHVPTLRTGPDPHPAFDRVVLRPYSDFLLHDVGALGDGIVQGKAGGTRMRTTPLWGLARRKHFLHDGRADDQRFEVRAHDAIAAHDGEAASSRDAYLALAPEARARLVRFLGSLGAAEFDVDRDGAVTAADWRAFAALDLDGFESADHPAAVCDVDGDLDFDLADFEVWMRALSPGA